MHKKYFKINLEVYVYFKFRIYFVYINIIVRNISMAAKISSFSDFGDNYRYLSYKYGIGIHVWHLPLCKLYKCFDLFLLNHHKTIANGVFIRDLCLLRENNIVDDDQGLTSTELTYMIDFLCTS